MHKRFTEYYMKTRLNTELRLYYCGREYCRASHSYGPAMRDHYLLHFIASGSGTFSAEGSRTRLGPGDSFCMTPNQAASYCADERDPWSNYWIGFGGRSVVDLLPDSPVVIPSSAITAEGDGMGAVYGSLLHQVAAADDSASEAYIYSLLWRLLAIYGRAAVSSGLIADWGKVAGNNKEQYVHQAIAFIKENFHKPLTVTVIAGYVGLERSYFTKLFHEQVGVAPYEFLQKYRIQKAALLLCSTTLSVQAIANSVGFDDASYFGKSFARRSGMSPSAYRRSHAKIGGPNP